MATRTVSFHTLVCDGCEQQFGLDVQYASEIEARAAAYAEGWRFPERVRKSRGPSRTVSDVCPKCVGGWERRPAPNPHEASRRRRAGSDG